jgi:flagellar basal body-associated protein FliL
VLVMMTVLVMVTVLVMMTVLMVVGFMVMRGRYNISRTLDGDCRTASSQSHRRSTMIDHGHSLSMDSLSDGSNIVFVLVLVCLVDLFVRSGRGGSDIKSLACEGGLYSASTRGQSVGGSTLRGNDGNRGPMHSLDSSRNTMLVVLVVVVLVGVLVMVLVMLVMVVVGRSGHGIGVSSKSGGVSFGRESDL